MAIVTDLSSDTGYGKTSPAKSVLPPITPLYDDNTAYNATFYPDKQVSAPSAAVQPVAYQAPIWESATQTYRDPASGLLAVGSDQTGWRWVTDAEYAAMQPVMAAPYSPPVGAVQVAAAKAISNLPGISFSALKPDYSAPEDLTWGYPSATEQTGWGTGAMQLSDQEAFTALTNPYAWEDTTAAWTDADIARVQQRYAMTEGIYAGVANVAGQHVPPFQRIATTARDASEGVKGILASAGGPGIAPSDPLYPSEENYRTWIEQWPYYTPETRAMLGQVQWAPDYVDINATGGGGYAPWNNTMYANRITDETMVHELAHAYYANVVQPGDRQEFLTNLQRLATETDPAYAWPSYLARTYYIPAIERSLVTEGTDSAWMGGEEHGGLWSAVMGNIYQLPPYMWQYYSGMFDTSAFAPEQTRFRTGSGYDQMPIAYGPGIPGTPASKVQPSRAPAPVMAPAPPPVVPTEDAYDLRGENITDADAYWQMYNPGGWEDVSARWYESDRGQVFNTPDFARLQDGTVLNIGPTTRTFYGPAGAEEKERERDLIYGDILRELGGQGLIEPLPERVTGLGDYYGYTAPVREHWNQKSLESIPYTEDALATFKSRPIGYLSSGIPAARPSEFSTADISYGGFMGEDGFMALGTPFFSSGPYIHERGHDWQNLTMSWEESAPANVDFMNSIKIAMADPTLPDWLRYAIVSGEQHGHNTGSPLLEIYATIAQEVPGRLHELPPYLLPFFKTLYTR